MIYLDYSATTPVSYDVLESYNKKLTNEKKILLAYEKQKQYLLNHMFI